MAQKRNPLDRVANLHWLRQMFFTNRLDARLWDHSQHLAGLVPRRRDWFRFLDLIMLALGTVFLIAGILFFFAFNWRDLPLFGRFAVVQGAVIAATVLAVFLDLDEWGGRMALAGATILVGVALGVVGTAYQTGADSYRLFVVWTMLITGWVLISRWNIMYLIWMVLCNVSFFLYWDQTVRTDYPTFNMIVIGMNFAFVVIWDLLAQARLFDFMRRGRWFLYIIMLPVHIYSAYLMIDYIFEFDSPFTTLGGFEPLIYGGLLAIIAALYVWLKQDLPMLALASLNVLVVLIAGIGRVLFELFGDFDDLFAGVAYTFIMGFVAITLTVGLVIGLRWLQERWGVEE